MMMMMMQRTRHVSFFSLLLLSGESGEREGGKGRGKERAVQHHFKMSKPNFGFFYLFILFHFVLSKY